VTYTIEFKQLKRHLKISWTQTTDGGLTFSSWKTKLSYPQWERISNSEKLPSTHWPGKHELYMRYDEAHVRGALVDMEAIRREQKEVPYSAEVRRRYGSWNGTTYRVQADILTDFGKQLLTEMPKCPPRKKWAAKPPSAERSRENIRLTRPQKDMLAKWPKQRRKAVPVGGERAEESRWIDDGHYPRASIQCLLKMELVEPGVSGMDMIDGRLTLDRENSPGVGLVYRMTILGALVADNDQ